MSDEEGGRERRGGYRLEFAKDARAGCKGPKPCKGTKFKKGELRFGTVVEFQGHTNFAWRHWGCVTPQVLKNLKEIHPEAQDIDGFEDIGDEYQAKVIKAYQDNHVADEDIPESARKKDEEEDQGDAEAEETSKPGRKSTRTKTAPKKAAEVPPPKPQRRSSYWQ